MAQQKTKTSLPKIALVTVHGSPDRRRDFTYAMKTVKDRLRDVKGVTVIEETLNSSPLASALARTKIDATEADVAALFEATVWELGAGDVALPEAEHDALGRVTSDLPAGEPDQALSLADLAIAHTAFTFASTLSTAEAAEHLGVNASTVTRRIANGGLYAIRTDHSGYRLPRWQFLGKQELLPGLASIVAAIPPRYSLEQLDAFVRLPNEDCGDRAPLAYLAAGGDPDVVADLIAELDQQ